MAETTIRSEMIYKGRILNLRRDQVELDGGRTAVREVVEHAPAVAIVALDEQERVLLVRQYRKPIESLLEEIPAGSMDPGEEPLAAAQRELAEETGFRARNWQLICVYFSAPGFTSEKMYLYLATGLEAGATNPDEDEIIEVLWMPLHEAYQAIFNLEIQDSKTIIGLQYAYWSCRGTPHEVSPSPLVD